MKVPSELAPASGDLKLEVSSEAFKTLTSIPSRLDNSNHSEHEERGTQTNTLVQRTRSSQSSSSSYSRAAPYNLPRPLRAGAEACGFVQALNNFYQADKRTPSLLFYKEVKSTHLSRFFISLSIGGSLLPLDKRKFVGTGLSKMAAKEDAARQAIQELQAHGNSVMDRPAD